MLSLVLAGRELPVGEIRQTADQLRGRSALDPPAEMRLEQRAQRLAGAVEPDLDGVLRSCRATAPPPRWTSPRCRAAGGRSGSSPGRRSIAARTIARVSPRASSVSADPSQSGVGWLTWWPSSSNCGRSSSIGSSGLRCRRPQPHQAGVDDDPMQPRREARALLEAVDRPEGRQEALLHGVAGLLLVTQEPARHGQQPPARAREPAARRPPRPRFRSRETRSRSETGSLALLRPASWLPARVSSPGGVPRARPRRAPRGPHPAPGHPNPGTPPCRARSSPGTS